MPYLQAAASIAAQTVQNASQKARIIVDNISKVEVPGAKKASGHFASLTYHTMQAPGAPTSDEDTNAPNGIQLGHGARLVSVSRTHSQGDIKVTENPLDMAMDGDGFFSVEGGDGTIRYTRDGSFKLTAERRIANHRGEPLVGPGALPNNTTSIEIDESGNVFAHVTGENEPQNVGQIEIVKFPNPSGLEAKSDNLYEQSFASGAPIQTTANDPAQGTGRVLQNKIETSNISNIQELNDLIAAQRWLDMAMQGTNKLSEMSQAEVSMR